MTSCRQQEVRLHPRHDENGVYVPSLKPIYMARSWMRLRTKTTVRTTPLSNVDSSSSSVQEQTLAFQLLSGSQVPGYKVALASRSTPANSAYKHFVFDASQPASVSSLFADVAAALGMPSVVIYNAASRVVVEKPLSESLNDLQDSLAVNSASPFMAAQEAVKGWDHSGIKGTGGSLGYKEKGYKFYYVDERTEEGNSVLYDRNGDAHAEYFLKLVEGSEQGTWLQTFVKGKGYKDFNEFRE
ncbi:hypothetical protein DL96DRAFT_1558617 [Flagelloscypha sp. PMI_526]|nr:hypothetical protein DL96DRAFT_1558617 [Flagelloscypha sp. PMI_526]